MSYTNGPYTHLTEDGKTHEAPSVGGAQEGRIVMEPTDETTLLEAYAIMAGSTMRLPEVRHLLALRNAHEHDLRRMLDVVTGPNVLTDVRLSQEAGT